jgi:hypothetical protein
MEWIGQWKDQSIGTKQTILKCAQGEFDSCLKQIKLKLKQAVIKKK